MALPSSYDTGTASIANGATAVTGQGTTWLTGGVQAGDVFIGAGLQAEILAVNSNTSITLAEAWPGSTRTTAAYRIRFTPDALRGLTAMNAVLSSITNGILYAFSALTSAANKLAYFTGAGTMATTDLTAHGRAVIGLSGGNGKFVRSTGTNTAVMQDILGTVAQSSGVPTGALVERGSNANGEYVRFADGTQICVTANIEVPYSGATSLVGSVTAWPAAFATNTYGLIDSIITPTGTSVGARAGIFSPSGINAGNFTPRYLTHASVPFASGDTRTVRFTGIGRWF